VLTRGNPVLALVEKEAGFLALQEIHKKHHASFFNLHSIRNRAVKNPPGFFQALKTPGLDVVSFQNAGRLDRFLQYIRDTVLKGVGAAGERLQHEVVGIPIHYDRREQIRLSKNEPVRRARVLLNLPPANRRHRFWSLESGEMSSSRIRGLLHGSQARSPTASLPRDRGSL